MKYDHAEIYRATDELADLFEIWTPNEIQQFIDNVGAGYDTLAGDMKTAKGFTTAEMNAWNILYAAFRKWKAGVNFLEKLTLSPLRTAEEYQHQLAYWRGLYQTKSGKQATGAFAQIPENDPRSVAMTALKVLAVGIGVYGAVRAMNFYRGY